MAFRTRIPLALALITCCVLGLPAQEPELVVAAPSKLEISWRATDSEGLPIAQLAPGAACTLHVTIHIREQDLRISGTSGPAGIAVRSPGIRGRVTSHDWDTGQATLHVEAKDSLSEPVAALTAMASVIIGDKKELWYRALLEKATLPLPAGRVRMSTAPLLYRGDVGPRDVLKVGEKAPDFTAMNSSGKDVSLSSFRDKKAVVLVFGRAHW